MIFQEKNSLKVQAQINGSTNKITIDGITTQSFTPEEAQTHMNTLLNIVDRSVLTKGMIRTRQEEAVNS